MNRRLLTFLLALLCFVPACNRDPEVARKKYLERGNAYYEKGKYKEALIMYRNALRKDPKFGEAYYKAALTDLNLGDARSALRDLHRAVEFQPDNLDAHRRLINLYIGAYLQDRNRPKAYVTELETIKARLEKRHPESYELIRLNGYLALTRNNAKEAADYFQKAFAKEPGEPDVIIMLMGALVQQGRSVEAEKFAVDAIARNSKLTSIYDALYLHYLREKRLEDAERLIIDKRAKNPDLTEAVLQLAAHYYMTRRDAEMRQTIDAMLQNAGRYKGTPYRDAGDFFLRIRDFASAERTYKAGLPSAKNDAARTVLNKRLVETYAQQRRTDEATKLVETLLQSNPKDDEALAMRASLRMMSGKSEDVQSALNDLQAVVSRLPKDAVVRYNLGRAYLMRGDTQQAKLQFEEAIKNKADYIPPRLALTELLLRNREWARAAQISQEAISLDNRNLLSRLLHTRSLIGMQELDKARAELNTILDLAPQNWEAKLQLAAVENLQNNPKGSETVFREMLAKTGDSRAAFGLADSLVRQKRASEAEQVLRAEVAKSPAKTAPRLALAALLANTGRAADSLRELQTVHKAEPKNVGVLISVGRLQRATGDFNGARASFQKATEIAPKDPQAFLELALLYETQKQPAQAKPLYEKVLQLRPNDPLALNNMAYSISEHGGDLDQALNMAQRARHAMPQEPAIADTLGIIYLKKNLHDSAINIFRDLVRQRPDSATFQYHLGMALAQKGDKPEAKKALEAALRSKPAPEEESKIRALMARIG